jgi:hypothetical protein
MGGAGVSREEGLEESMSGILDLYIVLEYH